jgi:hypothetical protein
MMTQAPYPIGTPGLPWGEAEVATWLARQTVKRSYAADVLHAIETLRSRHDVVQYGRLDYHPDKYPLFAIRSRSWRDALPCALVTGGVHGYETSGVHGALRFVDQYAVRQPLGLRSDSPLERARDRSKSIFSRRQPGARIGSPDAPGRANPRWSARAYRFA